MYLVTSSFFFLMVRRLRSSTLFPYTTLFRSRLMGRCHLPYLPAALELPGAGRLSERRTAAAERAHPRSEEHTSELQSLRHLVCRLLLEKKKQCRGRYAVYVTSILVSVHML